MSQILCFALILLGAAQFISGQQIILGKCAEPTRVTDFDISRFLGKWFEWGRYPHAMETGQKCSTVEYIKNENNTVTLVNRGVGPTGGATSIEGIATALDAGSFDIM